MFNVSMFDHNSAVLTGPKGSLKGNFCKHYCLPLGKSIPIIICSIPIPVPLQCIPIPIPIDMI